MNSCTIEDCKRESHPGQKDCILHCDKTTQPSSTYNNFLSQLINYIIVEFCEQADINSNKKELALQLKSGGELSIDTKEQLESITCQFIDIQFPADSSRDRASLCSILARLGPIHFDSCTFHRTNMAFDDAKKVFYQDCNFPLRWVVNNDSLLDDLYDKSLYQNCTFHETVTNKTISKDICTFQSPIFRNCTFNKHVKFQGAEFTEKVFSNDEDHSQTIQDFHIDDSTITKKFSLNNTQFNNFIIKDSKFIGKFEFRENQVISTMSMQSIKTENVMDLHNCKISSFVIKRGKFKGYAGFEGCEFGSINTPKVNNAVTFTYATFSDTLNFRDAYFNDGLDIAMINSSVTPNFHGVKVNYNNSNRETFRIIKHALDSVGNHIDANKFYAFEMKKYHDEIKISGSRQEKLIFSLNRLFSNFGQSYIKPTLWVIASSLLLFGIVWLKESFMLRDIYPPANFYISAIMGSFNNIAMNIIPFKRFLIDGLEFISLFFYIINISLIWLIITAIKRRTKR